MVERIAAYMEQYQMVPKGGHICVGVSGGADSVCLFRVLECLSRTMGFTLSVVHVEHGIRGEQSLSDMEFVRMLALRYEVPFSVYAFSVAEMAKERGLSVEEAGRNVRYEAFAKESAKYGPSARVALAHHAEDNAETLLFHMCRGTGLEGLAGIRPIRGNIIRPLLAVTRQEIEAFLEQEGQGYCADVTNEDISYSRNRIRKCVLPQLVQINGKAVLHINRIAEEAAEVSAYLKEKVDKIVKTHAQWTKEGQLRFDLSGWGQSPAAMQSRVMLALIEQVSGSRKDIAREHAAALLDLSKGQTGRMVSLPYGITAMKTYGALIFSQKGREAPYAGISAEVPMDKALGEICIPGATLRFAQFDLEKKDAKIPKNRYTKWFDYDKIKNRLFLRNRKPGDYFFVDGAGHRQKLKDYWINEKVPKEKRDQILLLADGSHIVWAVGYRISEYYKITGDTKRVLEVQYMEE